MPCVHGEIGLYIYKYKTRACFERNFGILYRCDSVLEHGSGDPRIDLVWHRDLPSWLSFFHPACYVFNIFFFFFFF